MLSKRIPPMHPGRLLARSLEERGWTQRELAAKLEVSVQTVSTLIKGHRGMTARLAVRLGRLFKTTPQMWMGLQVNRDLWFALHGGQDEHAAGGDAR